MGKFTHNHVNWHSDDNQSWVEITHTNTDTDYRQVYEVVVSERDEHGNYIVCYSTNGQYDHIRSGVGAVINAMDALKTFSSFVEAWLESLEHAARTGQDGENGDLFPATMFGWAEQYHDELFVDAHIDEWNEPDEQVEKDRIEKVD